MSERRRVPLWKRVINYDSCPTLLRYRAAGLIWLKEGHYVGFDRTGTLVSYGEDPHEVERYLSAFTYPKLK